MLSALLLSAALTLAPSNELAIARAALRDGLYDVARTHARAVTNGAARLILLECDAQEARWDDLKARLTEDLPVPARAYYGALAAARQGDAAQAELLLKDADFTGSPLAPAVNRLKAEMAVARGDAKGALASIWSERTIDPEARMLAAEAFRLRGDRTRAMALWRELALTNAPGVSAALRRAAGLRLGRELLAEEETFAEGQSLVTRLVRDDPGATGAATAYVALAQAQLARGEFAAAADLISEILETWPALAREASVLSIRGWALHELGRNEESLASFARAEASATNEALKAECAVKEGDILMRLGRVAEAQAKYLEVAQRYPETEAAVRLKAHLKLAATESEGRELFKSYRFAEARVKFAEVAERDPAHADRMKFFDVLCQFGLGADAAAEAAARRLMRESRDAAVCADAALWCAKLAYNRGEWSAAARGFLDYAAAATDPTRVPGAYLWSARAAFADGDYEASVSNVAQLVARFPTADERLPALLVEGEALINLARFDEALLLFDAVLADAHLDAALRVSTEMLKMDALFALGADNSERYAAALDLGRRLQLGENLTPSERLRVAAKVGLTLLKLRRTDEAIDTCYSQVLLAYVGGRREGTAYDERAKAAVARIALRLAEEFESRGRNKQAIKILRLVSTSDLPAAAEATRRIDRIQNKGRIL